MIFLAGHIYNLLHCVLLDPLLRDDIRQLNDLLNDLRHPHVQYLLDGALLDPLMRNDLGHLDKLCDDLRHPIVRDLLDKLPAGQQEVLELRFFQGQSFAEIAREMEVSSDEAARSRCRRAMKAAEKRLPKGQELL